MRNRLALLVGTLALCLIGGTLGVPASASDVKKFEATIALPGGGAEYHNIEYCPGGGEANGVTYTFIELKGDYTWFKASGPAHLVNEPSPVGVHDINDYDLDLFVFDDKCKELPSANGPAGTERLNTKRPARYALISYFSGVHPELPVTLEVSNSKIK